MLLHVTTNVYIFHWIHFAVCRSFRRPFTVKLSLAAFCCVSQAVAYTLCTTTNWALSTEQCSIDHSNVPLMSTCLAVLHPILKQLHGCSWMVETLEERTYKNLCTLNSKTLCISKQQELYAHQNSKTLCASKQQELYTHQNSKTLCTSKQQEP